MTKPARSLVSEHRAQVGRLRALGWRAPAIAAQLRIPVEYVDQHMDALEMDEITGDAPTPEPVKAEPEGLKRCPRCNTVKPIGQFSGRAGKRRGDLAGWCRSCDAHRPRAQTPDRLIRTRAFHRARAKLVGAHPEEFRDLMDTELALARAEAEGLMAAAESEGMDTSEPPRLLPGAGPVDEERAPGDRLDLNWCAKCSEFHDSGHACKTCRGAA